VRLETNSQKILEYPVNACIFSGNLGRRKSHDRTAVQRVIDVTDRDIDRLVYELYDLTEEEIGIVEGEGVAQ